jgi:hypothetical protein
LHLKNSKIRLEDRTFCELQRISYF